MHVGLSAAHFLFLRLVVWHKHEVKELCTKKIIVMEKQEPANIGSRLIALLKQNAEVCRKYMKVQG